MRRERKKGTKNIFEDKMARNFLHMGKETVIQVQEAQRVPYRMTSKGNTPRHTVIKMTKK